MTTGSAIKEKEKLTIVVVHNGVPREIDAPSHAAVQSVLSRAMAEFGVAGQPDYALFTEQNVEVNVQQSLRDAGVVDQQRLVLRTRTVRAGASDR
ncbi:MAG: DUF2604 domain-containing protein [bacterium]